MYGNSLDKLPVLIKFCTSHLVVRLHCQPVSDSVIWNLMELQSYRATELQSYFAMQLFEHSPNLCLLERGHVSSCGCIPFKEIGVELHPHGDNHYLWSDLDNYNHPRMAIDHKVTTPKSIHNATTLTSNLAGIIRSGFIEIAIFVWYLSVLMFPLSQHK